MSFLITPEIINLVKNNNITEAVSKKVTRLYDEKILSYGVDGSGYTVRLGEIFSDYVSFDDNKFLDSSSYYENNGRYHYFLTPSQHKIIRFQEEMNLPKNVGGLIYPKSSFSRVGIFYSTAVIEPGYKGTIDISIANLSNQTHKIYLGEGIAQIMFYWADGAKEYVGNQQQYTQLELPLDSLA